MMIVLVAACFLGCASLDIETPGTSDPGVSDTPNDDPNEDDPNDDPNEDDPNDDPNEDDPNEDDPNQDDPNQDDPNQDDPNEDDPNENDPPRSTKTTVYYTDSNKWGNVYAYLWNYSTPSKPKVKWPGERLTAFGTSGFGEKQYKVDVDYSVYDRVIFNNGGNKQTKDLVIGAATSGYYGEDGIFTMGTEDYGKVEYTTLTDTKNLSYISGGKKKISVYTPSGYTKSKKYGVLYMFDSQNLYIAANGSDAEKNGSPERWAVDVAVTNLVNNGSDGVIIVAIDNTDGHRDQELTMSQAFGTVTNLAYNNDFRNGKLDELGNFMKETLMPWVKSRYSVDTSRKKTGIAGSSSGGLAAYYLGLRDNDLYGYIGAFSPANGLFKSSDWTKFYNSKKADFGKFKSKVYVYCGQNDHDLEDMLLPETKRIKSGLKAVGFSADDITENYVDGATHNEIYWRIAFTEFLSKMVA